MFQEFSRNHQIDKISKILTSRKEKEEEFPNKEWKIIGLESWKIISIEGEKLASCVAREASFETCGDRAR